MLQLTTFHEPYRPTSCSLSNSSLTSSTYTHSVTKLCEFPYCFHFVTELFFLLHCLPIFSSRFLHVKFFENFHITILSLAHLPWIHLPHCRHKTELAFTLKLQTPHGSSLLLDKPSCVMPLQTIAMVFLIRMEAASLRPDYLSTLSAAKIAKLSLLVNITSWRLMRRANNNNHGIPKVNFQTIALKSLLPC